MAASATAPSPTPGAFIMMPAGFFRQDAQKLTRAQIIIYGLVVGETVSAPRPKGDRPREWSRPLPKREFAAAAGVSLRHIEDELAFLVGAGVIQQRGDRGAPLQYKTNPRKLAQLPPLERRTVDRDDEPEEEETPKPPKEMAAKIECPLASVREHGGCPVSLLVRIDGVLTNVGCGESPGDSISPHPPPPSQKLSQQNQQLQVEPMNSSSYVSGPVGENGTKEKGVPCGNGKVLKKQQVKSSPMNSSSYVAGKPNAEGFAEFMDAAQQIGISGSSVDWGEAQTAWKRLSVPERLTAVAGLRERLNAPSDPARKALPQNYLLRRMWERQVRRETNRAASRDEAFKNAWAERGRR